MSEPTVRQLRLVVTADDYGAAFCFYRDVLGLTEQAAFASPDGRVTILEAGRAKTDRRLASTRTHVNSNGVIIPLRTWALTTKETRLPGAMATPAPTDRAPGRADGKKFSVLGANKV